MRLIALASAVVFGLVSPALAQSDYPNKPIRVIVAAAAGAVVAKHGNRAMTGICGSADVLEALGIRVALTPCFN